MEWHASKLVFPSTLHFAGFKSATVRQANNGRKKCIKHHEFVNVRVRKTNHRIVTIHSGAYARTAHSWESRHQLYQLLILRKHYGSMTSLTGAWKAYRS